MVREGGGEFRIERRGGGVPPQQEGPNAPTAQIYAYLEAQKRATEEEDQRRIAAGDTAPWLGRRETWLTG
jgi:hypothetical protein